MTECLHLIFSKKNGFFRFTKTGTNPLKFHHHRLHNVITQYGLIFFVISYIASYTLDVILIHVWRTRVLWKIICFLWLMCNHMWRQFHTLSILWHVALVFCQRNEIFFSVTILTTKYGVARRQVTRYSKKEKIIFFLWEIIGIIIMMCPRYNSIHNITRNIWTEN